MRRSSTGHGFPPFTVISRTPTVGGNDYRIVAELNASGLLHDLHPISAAHDHWCAKRNGKPCDCQPWITVYETDGTIVWTNDPRIVGGGHDAQ